MSLFSALNAAVSGLRAQGAQISAVSENIANVTTTAYKTRELSFQSLVTGVSSATPSGGVVYDSFQDIRKNGLIEATTINTNVGINGNGFFVVADDPTKQGAALNYSRNGSFQTDAGGFLINSEGYYLYGWQTDSAGNVLAINQNDLSSLEAINVESVTGSAQQTSQVQIDANLPAEAAAGDIFQSSFEVFDGLGVSHTVVSTWTKNPAANEWTLDLADPVFTNDLTGPSTGTIAPNSYTITFDGNGNLNTVVPASNPVTITGFTTGSVDVDFNLDLGTPGATDGLTQFASNGSVPILEIDSIDQDGLRFGRLNEIQVDDNGLVYALFDNGLREAIYQIPIATFSNPGGLAAVEGTVYDENQAAAGNFILNRPGGGNAGNVFASSLELSTTDTSNEFNKMIVAQQGYSSSAQVISTADDLFDSLLRAVS